MNRIENKETYTVVLYEDVLFTCPKFGVYPVAMCLQSSSAMIQLHSFIFFIFWSIRGNDQIVLLCEV